LGFQRGAFNTDNFGELPLIANNMVDLDTILTPWQRAGVSLGLTRINQLLEILGSPQDQIPVIHVAGSNGKGSVCAYLSTILVAAGYRVGRYTSPHLVDWNERICINHQPIADDQLIKIIQHVQAASIEPTTKFELITAAAWVYFAAEQVDIAVIETGLGGRLDATNTVSQPLVTVITSISKEHAPQLGDTIAAIAQEKAGIIKSNCPIVIGQLPTEAAQVISQRAIDLDAPLIQVVSATQLAPGQAQLEDLVYELPLLGDIQMHNSAVAIRAIQQLPATWQITPAHIQMGIAKTQWPGRIHQTNWQGKSLLLDGAHNPEAAIALRCYIDQCYSSDITWIIGMLNTKEHLPILQALLRKGDRLHLVPVPDELTATPEDLQAIAQSIYPEVAVTTFTDWKSGLMAAYGYPEPVVMSGSLYLLGDFYRYQQILGIKG
jgi:dihydrofolate synthase / folylpolyglutamate synthase